MVLTRAGDRPAFSGRLAGDRSGSLHPLADALGRFTSGRVAARALRRAVGGGSTFRSYPCWSTGAGTCDASSDFIRSADCSGAFRGFFASNDACFSAAALASAARIAKRYGSFRARRALAFFVLKARSAVFRRAQAGYERNSIFAYRASLERGLGAGKNGVSVCWALSARCRRRNLDRIAGACASRAPSAVSARADFWSRKSLAGRRTVKAGFALTLFGITRRNAAVRRAACRADGADAHAEGAVYAEVFSAADRRSSKDGNGFWSDDAVFFKSRARAFFAGIEAYQPFRAAGKLRAILAFVYDGKAV